MNKIPLRKKYKMMKDNLSTNNIKNKNKENSKENDKEEKNKTLDKSEDNFSAKNNNILFKLFEIILIISSMFFSSLII